MNMKINFQEVKKLSTIVADKLAEQIQNGQRKPGERLIQNELATQFGVSRVAVRDGLMELRNRGLSVSLPMRGDIVRPVSCKTIKDVFEIRKHLESLAVMKATASIDKDGLQAIRLKVESQEHAMAKGNIQGIIEKDWEFHATIYTYCENTALVHMIENLWMQIRQARSIAKSDANWGTKWSGESIKRHKLLLRAIEAGDAQEAAKITADNIEKAGEELTAELKVQGWDTEEQVLV